MLNKYIIKLDNEYICGTYDNLFYQIEGPLSNNGFHQNNSNNQIEKLELSHEKTHAKELEGPRNLQSWVNKILMLHASGFICFQKMIIEAI